MHINALIWLACRDEARQETECECILVETLLSSCIA